MAIDVEALFKTAVHDGVAAAKGHSKDLRAYIEARARLVAEGAARLAIDRVNGDIDDDDLRFAYQEIRASEMTALPAIQATAKAAAQDAINAVLSVASAALKQATGVAIL
jgi:hypothetical protein